MRRHAAAVLASLAIAGCLPQLGGPPAPTPTRTDDRPRFELATYMYALQTKGKIRIGISVDDPPFAVRAANGRYDGFEADLGRELAGAIYGPRQDIDSVIDWVPVERAGAVRSLTASETDVVIARLVRAADDRPADIDLTEAYFVDRLRILIKSNDDEIKDLPDLDTKTVCVQQDTMHGELVEAANAFARTLPLDTYASCLGALGRGQVDAIAARETILWGLRKQDPDTKIVGRSLADAFHAIGAKRTSGGDRTGFITFLNTWLASAIRDGTWGRLYARTVQPLSGETRTAPTE
jgi:polar amino acid transport system substrate-binding protein